MRNLNGLAVLLSLCFASAANAEPAVATPIAATATVPVAELLRLYRLDEESRTPAKAQPPVTSSIQRLEMKGRLLENGIDVAARFEIAVLESEQWSKLPLLELGAATQISKLPSLPDASFSQEGGTLYLLTKRSGKHHFTVKLLERARRDAKRRTVHLNPGSAIVASLGIEYDEDLFRLESDALEERDRRLIVRKADGFEVTWQALGAPKAKAAATRPAVESTIPTVHASMVSTLEGRRIMRIQYRLRFAGRKPISFQLPAGQVLAHVFLNGVAIPAEARGRELALQVAPARAGDQAAQLELVLVSASEIGFHLAGALQFELPAVSWPTHELWFDTHLPRVFDYEWGGGSLAPANNSPSVSFAHRVPEPGHKLSFHQYLVTSGTPRMTLDYAVNLDGHYFKP